MRERKKDEIRRDGMPDQAGAGGRREPRERRGKAKAEPSPFHGALHSDHPQDPFRNPFGSSSLKFDF